MGRISLSERGCYEGRITNKQLHLSKFVQKKEPDLRQALFVDCIVIKRLAGT